MKNSLPVLLVEDDSVDALTVKRAFRELKLSNPLAHVTNGEEAIIYLRNQSNERPCIILLDINMPKMNGIEFLKIAKADESLRKIPVVVLSTSNDERDIINSYKLSVAGYIIKPVDYKKFLDTIKTIDYYWTLSKLPDVEIGGQLCKQQNQSC
jgi:CheY-like chemotaxis protein